jgi:hypothetical protein
MTRAHPHLRWFVGALTVLAAAAVVLASLWGRRGDDVPQASGAPVTAVSSIVPQEHLFGDRLVARLDVRVNGDAVDPGTVRVLARFEPYKRVGRAEVTRRGVAGSTELRYAFSLQCLERACLPGSAGRSFRFQPATVQYVLRDEPQSTGLRVDWPPVAVASRLTADDGGSDALRADTSDLPPVSYRMSPILLGWLLTGAAAAIVLAVGAAGALRVRPVRPVVMDERAKAEVPPLERVLALVEGARNDAEDVRRTALDELARTLDGDGLAALAPEARKLAWSRRPPDPDEVDRLAAAVRRALEAGS